MNTQMRFGIPMPGFGLAMGFCFGLASIALAQTPDTSDLAKERVVTINGKTYDLKSKLKAILMGDFYYNFNHNIGTPNLDSTITRIARAEKPAWTVDYVQGTGQVASKITTANLSKYQIFFGNYISSWGSLATFPAASQTAIQQFVEDSGKGVFIQHSSGDSRYNAVNGTNPWPWYFVMYPAQYNGEAGAGGSGSVGKVGIWGENNKAAKSNPILQGINWNGNDSLTVSPGMELHSFAYVMTNTTVRPAGWQGLLGLNPATCGTPNSCGNNAGYNYTTESAKGGAWGYPISWTYQLKKGNIGYFMEGHDQNMMKSMTQAVWDRYYKQFMYYLAGYDTASVTSIGIPTHDLTMGVDASGISFHPTEAAGVLITKSGHHSVALYDIAGHKITEMRGSKAPVDYNFDAKKYNLLGGAYILRVVVPGASRSKRVFLK